MPKLNNDDLRQSLTTRYSEHQKSFILHKANNNDINNKPNHSKNTAYEFLSNDGSNFDQFIDKLKIANKYIQDKNTTGAKFPITPFCYDDILKNAMIPKQGRDSEQVFKDFADIVDGSFRPQSHHSVFNMVPTPLFDATAAATLMYVYNNNSIMDSYGGKSVLYEQKIARSIARLIGWDEAYGISCNGGKLTLYYAIKSAILKIAANSSNTGIPDDLVILVPEGGHYSIEHTCSMLGLGANNCIRIPRKSTDGITDDDLKQTFVQQIKNGKRVAGIICCGGTTLDFASDWTQNVYNTVQKIVEEYQLDYFPYLHLDSVIGWLWFTFFNMTNHEIQNLTKDRKITDKIATVIEKFKGVKNFDSFSVDMHKNGLCPYSSSFFIAKNFSVIDGKKEADTAKKQNYGDIKAFQYTLENTRPTGGIASAWVALQRLGLNGYREYLIGLLQASQLIKSVFGRKYKIMNESSLGWEIIFSIDFPTLRAKFGHDYDNNIITETFIQHIWEEVDRGKILPNISIIKNFRKELNQDAGHGLILYPMQITIDRAAAEQMLFQISRAVAKFEQEIIIGRRSLINQELEAPIR